MSITDSSKSSYQSPPKNLNRSRWINQSMVNGLALLLGVGLSITAVYLVLDQAWLLLLGLALLLPAIILTFVYPFIGVLMWVLLFPIFLKEFTPGARYVFWLIHRVMIPATLGLVVLQNFVGIRKSRAMRLQVIDWAMILFLVLTVFNILTLTEDPRRELVRFYDRFFISFCMYWLIRFLDPTERDMKWLAPVAFFTILSQGVLGMLSWFAPELLPTAWLGRIGQRTTGSVANPAVYTILLLFCAIIVFQFARQTRSGVLRTLSFIAVGMTFFFVFFTFSRGSWLGSLFVLLAMVRTNPKPMLGLALGGMALAAVLFTMTPLSSYADFAVERLFTRTTAEGRITEGAATFEMIQTKPLTGWGFGSHELYDEQFRNRVLGLAVRQGEQGSHNTYLLLTAELGLPGLLLYLFPAAWLFARTLQTRRRLPAEGMLNKDMVWLLWALIACHFIAGNLTDLFQDNFLNTVIWWASLALIANMIDTGLNTVKQQTRITR